MLDCYWYEQGSADLLVTVEQADRTAPHYRCVEASPSADDDKNSDPLRSWNPVCLIVRNMLDSVLTTLTAPTLVARGMLRDASHFDWSTIMFLAIVVYIYTVEVEYRRWSVVLAGLSLWLMDWFNELVNSAVLHVSNHAALWTVTGHTSYLILVGLSIEISFFFAILGIIFVKILPADPHRRYFGVPNRVVYVLALSLVCVCVEISLNAMGVLNWAYWWWNVPFIPLIVIFGYATFFAVAAWVYDMGDNHRRQLMVVGGIAIVDALLALGLGLAGWLS